MVYADACMPKREDDNKSNMALDLGSGWILFHFLPPFNLTSPPQRYPPMPKLNYNIAARVWHGHYGSIRDSLVDDVRSSDRCGEGWSPCEDFLPSCRYERQEISYVQLFLARQFTKRSVIANDWCIGVSNVKNSHYLNPSIIQCLKAWNYTHITLLANVSTNALYPKDKQPLVAYCKI